MYLTKDEVAATLRVSVRTVSTYLTKGLLPQPMRMGRRLLWKNSDIEGSLEKTIISVMSTCDSPVAPVKRARGRPRKILS